MTVNNTIRRLSNDLGKDFFGEAHAKYQVARNGLDRLSAQVLDPHRLLRVAKQELLQRRGKSSVRVQDDLVLQWFEKTMEEIW